MKKTIDGEEINAKSNPNQLELIRRVIFNLLKSIIIVYGAKGSGKTIGTLKAFVTYILKKPPTATYLMCANTLGSLERNCLIPLLLLYGSQNISWSTSGSGKCANIFGRTVWIEGADNARSWTKIQGLTVSGVYVDELTNIDETFFMIALGSARADDENKIFCTTNPDYPTHWVKTKFIDKRHNPDMEIDVFFFPLEGNAFLPETVKNRLRNQYQGVYHDRFILGKWVAAEGAVYPTFIKNKKKIVIKASDIDYSKYKFSTIGVDIGGTVSGTAFIHTVFSHDMKKIGFVGNTFWNKETEMLAGRSGDTDSEDLKERFIAFLHNENKKHPAAECRFESAETYLKNTCQSAVFEYGLSLPVKNAIKGSILERIRFLNGLFATDNVFISSECTDLIAALESAVWNPKERTKDERLDDGKTCRVDLLDAAEYSYEPFMKIISNANGFDFMKNKTDLYNNETLKKDRAMK